MGKEYGRLNVFTPLGIESPGHSWRALRLGEERDFRADPPPRPPALPPPGMSVF